MRFDYSCKEYYYLTDDEGIEVGDYVEVPVGKFNEICEAEVVRIEYFSEDNVPIPISKTKEIIGKC